MLHSDIRIIIYKYNNALNQVENQNKHNSLKQKKKSELCI